MNTTNPAVSPGNRAIVKPRVLFVDDEQHILNSLRWLFKRDYDVTLAVGGQAAIDLMRQQEFHVVVSDQRMPGITGVEVLREAAQRMPNAMRILLTGYSDLKAIVGSVNEGEVFRFVTKPWANDELKAVVRLAAETALHGPLTDNLAGVVAAMPAKPTVLLIDQDPAIRHMLSEVLQERYTLLVADNLDHALDLLDAQEVHVVVSDTRIGGTDITALIKLLKKHQPDIVSVVITDHGDAELIISLINEGQVFRFLQKPVKPGQCRLSIQSAVVKHAQLRANPELTRRYAVEEIDEEAILRRARGNGDEERGLLRRMISRIGRLFGG